MDAPWGEKPSLPEVTCICRKCRRQTKHLVLGSEIVSIDDPRGLWVRHDYQIIKCKGCEDVSFRIVENFSENIDYDEQGNATLVESITYYPCRLEGMVDFDVWALPDKARHIYEETKSAIENDLRVLAGMGIRALVETVCKELNLTDKTLKKKIDALVEKSIITPDSATYLHKIRLLGNKAAHESEAHSAEQLLLALRIVEHMLDGIYVIPKRAEETFVEDGTGKREDSLF